MRYTRDGIKQKFLLQIFKLEATQCCTLSPPQWLVGESSFAFLEIHNLEAVVT